MPELPEVEAARRLIEDNCQGKIISRVVVLEDDKVFENTPEEFEEALNNRTVLAAHRKGKYLWLQLDSDGPYPLLHFGMTGSVYVEGVGAAKYINVKLDTSGDWPPKFTKFHLEFTDGTKLAFTDARRFARVKLLVNPEACEPVCSLGFDPLLSMPSEETFLELLRKRGKGSLRIKALLLDQAFSAGVGNWVADEVLYHARIHPEHPVGMLSDEQVGKLYNAITGIISTACAVQADSSRYPPDWLFHYRWTGKKASAVDGHAIDFVTAGGRTSAFVPDFQKLPAGVSSNGVKKAGKTAGKRKKGGASDDEDPNEAEEEQAERAAVEQEGPPKRSTKRSKAPAREEQAESAAAEEEGPSKRSTKRSKPTAEQPPAAGKGRKGKGKEGGGKPAPVRNRKGKAAGKAAEQEEEEEQEKDGSPPAHTTPQKRKAGTAEEHDNVQAEGADGEGTGEAGVTPQKAAGRGRGGKVAAQAAKQPRKVGKDEAAAEPAAKKPRSRGTGEADAKPAGKKPRKVGKDEAAAEPAAEHLGDSGKGEADAKPAVRKPRKVGKDEAAAENPGNSGKGEATAKPAGRKPRKVVKDEAAAEPAAENPRDKDAADAEPAVDKVGKDEGATESADNNAPAEKTAGKGGRAAAASGAMEGPPDDAPAAQAKGSKRAARGKRK